MKLLGERWIFQIGNSEIFVDNAYTLSGWTQERLIVNGTLVKQTGAWFGLKRIFEEKWLTGSDSPIFRIELSSTFRGLVCDAYFDDVELSPAEWFEASWIGSRMHWPSEIEWKSPSLA